MKIHKKILSLFMALTLLFSSAVSTYAANENWASGPGGAFNNFRKYYTEDDGYGRFNSGDTTYTSLLEYDEPSNTYTYNHISNNSYSSYQFTDITYNNETNTYEFVTNNTNYYITYSPTYVTVMYFDETTQQNIKNDYYYQLPDGRSSYELTANDVYGTYFIYNALNYDEVVEDDGKTLALFHLDGDLKNSSAVNTSLSPTVTSLSYADSKFNYGVRQTVVDNTKRSFSITKPTGTKSYDFWVYYSSQCYNYNGFDTYSNVQPGFYYDYNVDKTLVSVSTDTWHHYAISYNGTNYDLYVDGVYKAKMRNIPSSISNSIYTVTTDTSGYYVTGVSTVYLIDEFRISNIVYSNNFTPMSQPYDTNLVLVLPDSGLNNDIAIKSNVVVNDIRVGGVRPTIPNSGDVYVYLEDDIVKDVQQYQVDGWYSVDASIYENNSWVTLLDKDLSSYTIIEDDFNDTNTDNDNSGNNAGSTDTDNDSTGLLSSIMDKITGFFTGLLDILFGGILDLITVITDNLTGIIDGFTGITGFLGSLFGFLPEQMVSVLTSGLAVIVVVIIIKIFI